MIFGLVALSDFQIIWLFYSLYTVQPFLTKPGIKRNHVLTEL